MPKRPKQRGSLDFLMQSVKHPRQLGTPFQSSKFLVDAVVRELVGETIVELGAGTGPVTKGILDYLSTQGRLVSFEINPALFRHLKKIHDSRLTLVQDSAERLDEYISQFDCVVSGLPLTSLPNPVCYRILDQARKARRFIQYKYASSTRMLEEYFSKIRVKREWRNFPPAVIYVCER